MGTNFYWTEESCAACGRGDEEVHIGKSSVGWVFALHVYPDDGVKTIADWMKRFSVEGSSIRDEYGTRIHPSEMVYRIACRTGSGKPRSAIFYADNHAEPGPQGLLRQKIDERCIGHGEGTWDYIVGEFS